MGTYINIEAQMIMKPENEKLAVQAVRDLNKRDDLKRGGSSNGQKWFSWMPEDYTNSIETIEDIFSETMLGFNVWKRDNGDGRVVYDMSYNDKWGQHEVFFIAIAPFMEEMTVSHYCDELEFPDQVWRIELDPETKEVHLLHPEITINYPIPSDDTKVTYEDYKPYSYAGEI